MPPPSKYIEKKGLKNKKINTKKNNGKKVTRLGLEPRLFWTKTRRVASYTIGQNKATKVTIKIIATKKLLQMF